MRKENTNVVFKKSCHSRDILSGIFHVLSCYTKHGFMQICPLSLRERMGVAQVRGKVNKATLICTPSSALWASSPSRGKGAFTLIELLVVVLIIGILAAVAVPQYQKAVEKARLAEAFVLGKHFKQMEELYKMANGNYTGSFEELQADIPAGYSFDSRFPYTLSKGRSSFQIENQRIIYYYSPGGTILLALFFWFDTGSVNGGKIHCYPYTSYGQKLCGSLPL